MCSSINSSVLTNASHAPRCNVYKYLFCVDIYIQCHSPAHRVLTVGYGLHAEAQQCVQEVHNVIERVFVDVLAHRLTELHLVQLVKAGQTILGLRGDKKQT